MEYKMKRTLMRTVIFAFSIAFFSPANAAFVDGLETFDGTVKDTTAWEETGPYYPSRITQNDSITTAFGGAGYCTRYVTAGVGQTVSVQVMNIQQSTDPYAGKDVSLYLTTNDGDYTNGFDSHYIYLHYGYSFSQYRFLAGYGGGGSGTGSIFGAGTPLPAPGEYFTLQIYRDSVDHAFYSVYDHNGQLIDQRANSFSGMPKDLYVCLDTSAGFSATFDNVKISQNIARSECIEPPIADLNGDCRVDLADLAMFAAEWLTCGRIDNDCWD